MKRILNTPWGPSQTDYSIAPGLTSVSTAGHGGIRMDDARTEEFLRAFGPLGWAWVYAPKGWLEEDCDCNAAVLLWPSLFRPDAVRYAVRYARSGTEDGYVNHRAMARFLATPAAAAALAIAGDSKS